MALLERVALLRDTQVPPPPPAAADREIDLGGSAGAVGDGLPRPGRRARGDRTQAAAEAGRTRAGAATRRHPADRIPADRRRRPSRGPPRGRGHRRAVRRRGRAGQVPGRGDHPDRRYAVHGRRDDRARAGPRLRPELACGTRRYAAHSERHGRRAVSHGHGLVRRALPSGPAERAPDRRALHRQRPGRRDRVAHVVAVPYAKDVAMAPTPQDRAGRADGPRAVARRRPARPHPLDLRVRRRLDRRVHLDGVCGVPPT